MSDSVERASERTVVNLRAPGVEGRVTLSLKRDATTLSVNTVPSFTFDLKGRLIGGFNAGRTYRRTLDHRVVEKVGETRDGGRIRRRRELPPDEKRALVETAYGLARRVEAARQAGTLDVLDSSVPAAVWQPLAEAALPRIAAVDNAALEADAQAFLAVYEPIGILPPDQYRALVLQATQGCSYNKCTFCSFYRGRAFRIKTLPQFQAHIEAVKAFHGPALPVYRSIFLGEANALIAPQRLLVPMLDAVNAAFELVPPDLSGEARARWRAAHPAALDGVYAFVSALDALRKTADEVADLKARGLRRVYIGLESGDEDLLRFLNKPNTAAQALEAVQTLKAGEVAVGVVVMLGVGGARYADQHVRHTTDIVNAMRLDMDDLLYFSEYVDQPGTEYDLRATEAAIGALSAAEMQAQRAALQAGLTFAGPPPKVAVYDIREFAY
ncbi:MAG: radical SAM protein [Anaerolineae bacterium]|nr:radical SAM protein [Anaerolineae bacterium]